MPRRAASDNFIAPRSVQCGNPLTHQSFSNEPARPAFFAPTLRPSLSLGKRRALLPMQQPYRTRHCGPLRDNRRDKHERSRAPAMQVMVMCRSLRNGLYLTDSQARPGHRFTAFTRLRISGHSSRQPTQPPTTHFFGSTQETRSGDAQALGRKEPPVSR
jgi:hypothetical protein